MSDESQELGITESKSHKPGEGTPRSSRRRTSRTTPRWAGSSSRNRAATPLGGHSGLAGRLVQGDRRRQRLLPDVHPRATSSGRRTSSKGFDPEVAWVTQGGHEELEERLAVRPTSESIIAPFMAEWTRSHRDLPMRLNQWCSVVRWEATETKPFFRTKEFMWQEGHRPRERRGRVGGGLDPPRAVRARLRGRAGDPGVLRGKKPEHDKFPGADTTTTVEALMPDGKSVQGRRATTSARASPRRSTSPSRTRTRPNRQPTPPRGGSLGGRSGRSS